MELWTVLNESLYTLTMALIPVVGTILAFYIRKWLGDRAAQIAQQMFQAAAERAAAKALNQTPSEPKAVGTSPSPSTVAIGVDYLKTTMKETIAKIGISDSTLADVVEANIGKIKLAGVTPLAAPGGKPGAKG